MSQDEKKQYIEEDEISLIDLLVVLLKYRRLIIGVVLFTIVVSIGGYFWYPQRQYESALEGQKIEATLQFSYTPVVSLIGLQGQIKPTILQAPLLLEALQQAGYEFFGYGNPELLDNNTVDTTNIEDRSRALYLVRRKLMENKDAQGNEFEEEVFDITQSGNEVDLLYRNTDTEKAKAFLNAVFNLSQERFVEKVRPQAENVVSAYERLLAIENPNQGVQSTIETGRERYDAAKQLLSGEEKIFVKMSEPYLFETELSLAEFRSSFKVKAVVLVLAGLFLSIFLAFVLNALHNVKSDPESMEKINEALGKGPHSRKPHGRGSRGSDKSPQGRA